MWKFGHKFNYQGIIGGHKFGDYRFYDSKFSDQSFAEHHSHWHQRLKAVVERNSVDERPVAVDDDNGLSILPVLDQTAVAPETSHVVSAGEVASTSNHQPSAKDSAGQGSDNDARVTGQTSPQHNTLDVQNVSHEADVTSARGPVKASPSTVDDEPDVTDGTPDNAPNNTPEFKSVSDMEARHVDGTGNNVDHAEWGTAGATLERLSFADYADGIGEPQDRGDARAISNTIMAQDGDIPNSFGVSDIFTYFGQFIDHDIDLTHTNSAEQVSTTIAAGDPIFAEGSELSIDRSQVVDGTGVTTPREQANAITSFVDASNIYGSSDEVHGLLRADGGTSAYLMTSEGDYAPTLGQMRVENPDATITDAELLAGQATDDFYVGGDVRINENIALTSMHTIWIREHNFQVDRLKELHPLSSDDQIFEAAKTIVEAEYQNIVFNEYLPLLLGADNIPDYVAEDRSLNEGYDGDVNPNIFTEFSTAAFRLGHSQLSSTFHRTNEDGSVAAEGNIGLFQAFFNPTELQAGGGVDPLIRGLISNLGQEIDVHVVDDIRNLLFGPPGVGSDLAVLNILRGREHGLPSINDVREAMGLEKFADFTEMTGNAEMAAKFAQVYTSVDDVDLWVGGLSEVKVEGSQLGSTFHEIVLEQFMRLRDGDRDYFEDRMQDNPELLAQVKAISLSDIIQRTTDIDHVQDDVFIAHERIGGTDANDKLVGDDDPELMIGFGGNDKLFGKGGDDDLYGDGGRDKLKGGDGEDVINGGAGNDKLWGGNDADIFVFDTGSGKDKIKDFNVNEDRIDLSDYGFTNLDQVLDAAGQKNGTTKITLDDDAGDSVALIGVKIKALSEDNFIFDDDDGALA